MADAATSKTLEGVIGVVHSGEISTFGTFIFGYFHGVVCCVVCSEGARLSSESRKAPLLRSLRHGSDVGIGGGLAQWAGELR